MIDHDYRVVVASAQMVSRSSKLIWNFWIAHLWKFGTSGLPICGNLELEALGNQSVAVASLVALWLWALEGRRATRSAYNIRRPLGGQGV